MSKRSAFSLVEMLVAIVLLTMLIGVAIFALKFQLIAIHKTQKIGINNAITYNQIRSSLQSIKYYIVDDYDSLGYPMQQLHPFFNATSSGLFYITQNPIFSEDIALASLKCEDDVLKYREEPLYGRIDFLQPALLEDSQEITLYKNLEECGFTYVYDKNYYRELKNKIPSSIVLTMKKKSITEEIYVNIKTDYNRSIGLINDAIYPVE